jgi:hypothetical protein
LPRGATRETPLENQFVRCGSLAPAVAIWAAKLDMLTSVQLLRLLAVIEEAGTMTIRALKNRRVSRACLSAAVVAAVLALPHRTASQTAASPGAAHRLVSQKAVYTQVFRQVIFLDHQADVADQRGQNGSKFRNYFQAGAGLTPSEAGLLKSTALDALKTLDSLDDQIHTQVVIYRQAFRNGAWPPSTPLPPIPPEARRLQAEKDKVVRDHVASLQSAFGAERFQRFDAYVQAAVAPHISSTPVKIPAPTDGRYLPPLEPVPWK